MSILILFSYFCFSDLAKVLGEAIEKEVVYERQPYDEWCKKLQGFGLPEWMASTFLETDNSACVSVHG